MLDLYGKPPLPATGQKLVYTTGNKYPRIAVYASARNSLICYNEVIKGILEYAAEKLILHIYPKDLLLVDDYEVTNRINEPSTGNITKNWL